MHKKKCFNATTSFFLKGIQRLQSAFAGCKMKSDPQLHQPHTNKYNKAQKYNMNRKLPFVIVLHKNDTHACNSVNMKKKRKQGTLRGRQIRLLSNQYFTTITVSVLKRSSEYVQFQQIYKTTTLQVIMECSNVEKHLKHYIQYISQCA